MSRSFFTVRAASANPANVELDDGESIQVDIVNGLTVAANDDVIVLYDPIDGETGYIIAKL